MTWVGVTTQNIAKNGKTAKTVWDAIRQIDKGGVPFFFTYEENGSFCANVRRMMNGPVGFPSLVPNHRSAISYSRVLNDYSKTRPIMSDSSSQQVVIDDAVVVNNSPNGFRRNERLGKRSIRLLTEAVRTGVIPVLMGESMDCIPTLSSILRAGSPTTVSPSHVLFPEIIREVVFAKRTAWEIRVGYVSTGKFEIPHGSHSAAVYGAFQKIQDIVADDAATIIRKLSRLMVPYDVAHRGLEIYDHSNTEVWLSAPFNSYMKRETSKYQDALLRCYENGWAFSVCVTNSANVYIVNDADYVLYRTVYG